MDWITPSKSKVEMSVVVCISFHLCVFVFHLMYTAVLVWNCSGFELINEHINYNNIIHVHYRDIFNAIKNINALA